MAIQNRHDKDEAFQWDEFGHSIDLAFSMALVWPGAPRIPFFASSG
jgi:hypothetical protein